MGDDEMKAFAADFRKGILGILPSDGMCLAVCMPLAGLFRVHGVDCEMVMSDLNETDHEWENHCWLRLSDGRALDPTADQFEGMPPVYLGEPQSMHLPTKDTPS